MDYQRTDNATGGKSKNTRKNIIHTHIPAGLWWGTRKNQKIHAGRSGADHAKPEARTKMSKKLKLNLNDKNDNREKHTARGDRDLIQNRGGGLITIEDERKTPAAGIGKKMGLAKKRPKAEPKRPQVSEGQVSKRRGGDA